MNIGINRAELHLQAHQVLRVYDSVGARVECVRGALWITQDRDFEDHFLAANDALTLDRRGLALIHAQQPSEFVLFEPAPRTPSRERIARAVGRWLARTFGPESIERMRGRAWHHGL
jgi:redox-sensitive bicupin YhaK (pirin superfamily)